MDKPGRRIGRYWSLAAAGGELVFGVTSGALIGQWLDHRLGTSPWLTAGGVLLGFALGMWALFIAVGRE